MRTLKNLIYNCKVINFDGLCIHDKDYHTLKDVALDLHLTNDVVYNISSRKGNYNTLYKRFKYQPEIIINKILKDE